MESRCSNFSAQICRRGDYQLRLARSSAYVQAKVAPNLTKNLVNFLNIFMEKGCFSAKMPEMPCAS